MSLFDVIKYPVFKGSIRGGLLNWEQSMVEDFFAFLRNADQQECIGLPVQVRGLNENELVGPSALFHTERYLETLTALQISRLTQAYLLLL